MGNDRHTFCRICEASCGLIAEVEGGVVSRLRPDKAHPTSAGFVCAKGTRFAELGRHEDRLLSPRVRTDGRLEDGSWDQAYAIIGERLRRIIDQHGPHAVALYWGNPLAYNAVGMLANIAFSKALKSRNVFAAGSQDCNNKFAAGRIVHGSPFIQPIPDFERADLAFMLGTNPAVSQTSFVHLPGGARVFDALMKRGGQAVWVDPRRTESAARWGQHVAIRPGTDLWLVLALLQRLEAGGARSPRVAGLDRIVEVARGLDLDEVARLTRVPRRRIDELAALIHDAGRTAFHMSVGVNQGPFGTLTYVALQALAFVTGNFDVAGGSVFHPLASVLDRVARSYDVGYADYRSRIGDHPATLDTLPAGILAEEITTPGAEQIRALIVIAGDPVRSVPGSGALEKALGQLDLLVCVDLFESATGQHADVILPTPTWLERADVALPGLALQAGGHIQLTGAVADAPAEVRSEARILAELSLAMGRPMIAGSRRLTRAFSRAPFDAVLGALSEGTARLDPSGQPGFDGPAPKPGTYLDGGSRHEDGRVHFWAEALEPELDRMARAADRLKTENGFVLMCRRRRLGHNSWLHGGTRSGKSEASAWLHPADMAALGAHEGASICIRSREGELVVSAVANADTPRSTVVVPHGLPQLNVNRLIPVGDGAIEPLSGMLVMTGIPVDVTLFDAAG